MIPRRLNELLRILGSDCPTDVAITDVVYDSRQAEAGSLFVAVRGFHVDGHDYVADAVSRGAAAVIAQRPISTTAPVVVVPDSRTALALIAAELAGNPSRKLNVIGVTGTDGKTTSTTMIWAALQNSGVPTACATTVDFRCRDESHANKSRQTTQEAPELQELLNQALNSGCTHFSLETSSHSLALHRVDGIAFTGAVFTAITSEHLELHGSREAYLAAKARLLQLLDPQREPFAIFDADDAEATPKLMELAPKRSLKYSAQGQAHADLRATSISTSAQGTEFVAVTPWGSVNVHLQIPGRFNVSNALAAIAAAGSCDVDVAAAAQGVSALTGISGRMERVDLGQPFAVVIDYAHTADSLGKVLRELRPITKRNLWVVFGSAGMRDREKRPAMGRVAAQLADQIVITDEDPREEDRNAILNEIAAGAIDAGARANQNLHLIADRPAAVAYAIANAKLGDTVLLAGKGHESSLIGPQGSAPYSERAVAETALQQLNGAGAS